MKTKKKITLSIILARGGSKGVPRKNITELRGKPIIAYSIYDSINSKNIDKTVVSTEDNEIASISQKYGAEIILRPAEYASDAARMELALRHAVTEIEKQGHKVGIVVSLYACVPIRNRGVIDNAIDLLVSTGADSIQTFSQYRHPPQWASVINGDKPTRLEKKYDSIYRRQDLVPAYYPDGAVIALQRDTLFNKTDESSDAYSFLGNDRRALIQKPEDTVNIDEPIDLIWAKTIIEHSNVK